MAEEHLNAWKAASYCAVKVFKTSAPSVMFAKQSDNQCVDNVADGEQMKNLLPICYHVTV